MGPEDSFMCSEDPILNTILPWINLVHTHVCYSLRCILLVLFHLCLGPQSCLFHSGFLTKTFCIQFSFPLWVLHSLPIAFLNSIHFSTLQCFFLNPPLRFLMLELCRPLCNTIRTFILLLWLNPVRYFLFLKVLFVPLNYLPLLGLIYEQY